VGFPHDIKGNALYGFVILKETGEYRNRENLSKEINQQISNQIGPIAKLDKTTTSGLPKTRSGKIIAFYVKLRKETILILEHLYLT
jgi:acetyl-CoA synthetase